MLTIPLPDDLETSLLAAVEAGRFASVEAAMVEAVRLLLLEPNRSPRTGQLAPLPTDYGPGSIGAMREDADLLDQVVEQAMRRREERSCRLKDVE